MSLCRLKRYPHPFWVIYIQCLQKWHLVFFWYRQSNSVWLLKYSHYLFTRRITSLFWEHLFIWANPSCLHNSLENTVPAQSCQFFFVTFLFCCCCIHFVFAVSLLSSQLSHLLLCSVSFYFIFDCHFRLRISSNRLGCIGDYVTTNPSVLQHTSS